MAQWCVLLALLAAAAVARCSAPARLFVPPTERLQDGVEAPLGLPAGVAPNLTPPRHWHARTAPRAAGRRVAADAVDPWRLPTTVTPTYYQLALEVDMEKLSFVGSVSISLNVLADTNTIVLHADSNLKFTDDHVKVETLAAGGEAGEAIAVTSVVRSVEYKTVTITLDKALEKGKHYVLSFTLFQSELNSKSLSGFYVSSYEDETGTRYLATTQFESTSARKAFPCFDEPSFKARFDIRITHDKAYSVRSNMPEKGHDDNDDGKTTATTFQTTVPMSTYLLAWVVSDFEHLSNDDGSFNTWARKDIVAGGDMSQEVGPKALEQLAGYTGIPYALTKTDQFAIPDFQAGAMENWGLVTYREELLIKTESTDVRYELQIATVICHELAHQWTGNLVTMDWWSNTWLNEGFATFFENFICDKLKPEMKLIEKAITTYADVAMTVDLQENQHAMTSDVSSPDDIEDKFDRISYAKGGTVLRMFQHILTPAVFQKGLARYLAANMFKNGTPDRLFRAINAEVMLANKVAGTVPLPEGADFIKVAKSWTEQAGVPVVKVTCDFKAKKCTLTQQQLRLASSTAAATNKWYIPVTIVTSKSPSAAALKTVAWLRPEDASVTVDIDVDGDADDWVIINPQQTGYYRVSYDSASWARLLAAVKDANNKDSIDAASRAQLLTDTLGLVNSGLLDWPETVKVLEAVKDQGSSGVWLAGWRLITTLGNELANTDVYSSFKIIIKDLTENLFSQIGLKAKDGDDHNTRHLRYYVASYACDSGNALCLAEAKEMLADLLNNGDAPSVDSAAAVLCYGIRASDETVFNSVKNGLWEVSRTDPDMHSAVTSALACTNDQSLVVKLLEELLAKTASAQSKLDLLQVLRALITPLSGHRRLVVDQFRAKLQKLDTFFGDDDTMSSSVTSFLLTFIDSIRSESEYRAVEQWATSSLASRKDYKQIQDALQRANTRLDRWYRKNYEKVAAYIYQTTDTTPPPTSPAPTTKPTSGPGPTTQPGPGPTGQPATTPKPNGASLVKASAASMLALVLAVVALAQRS